MSATVLTKDHIYEQIDRLIEENRATCLWSTPKDYPGPTDEQRLRALDLVERYGDRQAFMRARELRDWLLHNSRKP